jgi:hypothetical protein
VGILSITVGGFMLLQLGVNAGYIYFGRLNCLKVVELKCSRPNFHCGRFGGFLAEDLQSSRYELQHVW